MPSANLLYIEGPGSHHQTQSLTAEITGLEGSLGGYLVLFMLEVWKLSPRKRKGPSQGRQPLPEPRLELRGSDTQRIACHPTCQPGAHHPVPPTFLDVVLSHPVARREKARCLGQGSQKGQEHMATNPSLYSDRDWWELSVGGCWES